MQTSYTNVQIRQYFVDLKEDFRARVLEYNKTHPIKQKFNNISEDATESLAYNLIADGTILKNEFKNGIRSIKRRGKKGADILINNILVVEVKGTSSKNGFITTNSNNFKAFAWIWFDVKGYFNGNDTIIVNILKNPLKVTLTQPIRNGQCKLSLKNVMALAKEDGSFEEVKLDFNTFGVKSIKEKEFFT